MNRMRVISGTHRGRRLSSPSGMATRPTSERAREAVFNSLGAARIRNARCLDLFAGSGAMGIEALSRGAASCVFVESDRNALSALRANIDACGLAAVSSVEAGDAVARVGRLGRFHLAFADPPYAFDGWRQLLASVSADVLVAETSGPLDVDHDWDVVRQRRYGRAWMTTLSARVDDVAVPTTAGGVTA